MIAEMVGFDFQIKLVADKNYGKKMGPDTWNGMIGELRRGVSFCLIFKYFD